jgi:hypothetical protein
MDKQLTPDWLGPALFPLAPQADINAGPLLLVEERFESVPLGPPGGGKRSSSLLVSRF